MCWGRVIDVQTGQVGTGKDGDTVCSSAIGSCVAVVLYDPVHKRGGVTHIMLPGAMPPEKAAVMGDERLRYAEDGIAELLGCMRAQGSGMGSIKACIAGGANVLDRPDDTVCQSNIASVLETLRKRGVAVCAQSVGGNLRRRIRLDTSVGVCFCARGDGGEEVLCRF